MLTIVLITAAFSAGFYFAGKEKALFTLAAVQVRALGAKIKSKL